MSKVISFAAAKSRIASRKAVLSAAQTAEAEAGADSWCDMAKRPETLGALAAMIGASAPCLYSAR